MVQVRVIIRNKAAVDLWPSVSLSYVRCFFFVNTKASPARIKNKNFLGEGVNDCV